MIAPGIANNDPERIADHKSSCRLGLPPVDTAVSGGSHGQDNELDTHKEAQLGLTVLSRIMRQLIGNTNVAAGSPYYSNCQKSYAYFTIEEQDAQGPKTTNPNTYIPQPRDLTAYEYNMYLLRGRSFHSSSMTKGSSRKALATDNHDSNIKDTESLNPPKTGSESPKSVSS